MATTGTYNFAPSAADIVLNSYGMIQIRRPELTTQHLVDAAMASNLLMVDISNRNPNRWLMETVTQALTSDIETYNLNTRVISVAIAYIDTTTGGETISRVLGPISATDYASIANKGQTGVPTSYFFSLTSTPTITLWPVPDDAATYTLRLQTFRQTQDVNLTSGYNVDTPYRFLDAFSTGLAARLAMIYPPKDPNAADKLEALYEKRMSIASAQDQEDTPLVLGPAFGGYYR